MIAYSCINCKHTFSRIADGPARRCPQCGSGSLFLELKCATGTHRSMELDDPRRKQDSKMRACGDPD